MVFSFYFKYVWWMRTNQTEFGLVRADLRTYWAKLNSDSEQMTLTGTKYRKRHSVSVEQIQDNPPLPNFKRLSRNRGSFLLSFQNWAESLRSTRKVSRRWLTKKCIFSLRWFFLHLLILSAFLLRRTVTQNVTFSHLLLNANGVLTSAHHFKRLSRNRGSFLLSFQNWAESLRITTKIRDFCGGFSSICLFCLLFCYAELWRKRSPYLCPPFQKTFEKSGVFFVILLKLGRESLPNKIQKLFLFG